MKFDTRSDLFLVSAEAAVKHPTMFGPTGKFNSLGGKLPLKYDASYFNDWENKYTWAFTLLEPVRQGQVFTFASVDCEVTCVFEGGVFHECANPVVVRDANRVPLRLEGTSPPQVTILIVTMDRRDLLELTLWYIYETSTDEERNIWIWDNGSHDDTPAFLGSMAGWPGVRCFRSETNLGLVGGRKRMLPYVETPYVFTLDDDMWPLNKGWAGGVGRAMVADPSIYQLALS